MSVRRHLLRENGDRLMIELGRPSSVTLVVLQVAKGRIGHGQTKPVVTDIWLSLDQFRPHRESLIAGPGCTFRVICIVLDERKVYVAPGQLAQVKR